MFTGIVAAIGRIDSVTPLGAGPEAGMRLTVDAGDLPLDDVAVGDSIAIEGACMTAVTLDRETRRFAVDVSQESLSLTVGLARPGAVNLEKALRANDRLGGHLVSGHIDGLGQVVRFEPVGESYRLDIVAPRAIGRYLAYKGSITVNGVSLTVNAVDDTAQDGCAFSINLIPHTIAATTLKHLAPGARVNLEIDQIARYVERILSAPKQD
ncbi:riboflavin synthase [Robbsia sp. Bb-Pol-6]|uniref:Riboflavin synthase n=1 Tax=Robbsia betulipollinis TaxID=2981849 RepID=A0ABT3ZMW8_9BURK|nr:riboflavin synthase [Robbsia betulipollinis]MCY0387600.1 riboflavin synthase [Robbsia betulipollinis]